MSGLLQLIKQEISKVSGGEIPPVNTTDLRARFTNGDLSPEVLAGENTLLTKSEFELLSNLLKSNLTEEQKTALATELDMVRGIRNTLTGGVEITVNGERMSLPVAAGSSGIPFVMPSSGTVNNAAGSITVSTAFDYVIGPSYAYFPADALHAASPAGWYYTLWTAATMGTVYADTYQNGTPIIPASPTPLVTVGGAYTQAINFDVTGPNYVVPGGMMGVNGYIEWGRTVNNSNSAGTKGYNVYFGGALVQGTGQTTNPRLGALGTLKNRGRVTAQISTSGAHGDPGNASTLPRTAIDTSENQIFSMSIRLGVATDYAIIESHHVRVWNA